MRESALIQTSRKRIPANKSYERKSTKCEPMPAYILTSQRESEGTKKKKQTGYIGTFQRVVNAKNIYLSAAPCRKNKAEVHMNSSSGQLLVHQCVNCLVGKRC